MWLPNAVITIGGIAYTSEVLWDAQISYGRTSIWDQARASYATVRILNITDTHNVFDLNDEMVITLDDSVGSPVTVFTGTVTSIENNVQAIGTSGESVIQTVSAVGPFAFMSRKTVGTTAYPKEYDDYRINRIYTEAGVTVETVDTPGVYEFTARAADASDAYTLAAKYASQALGYIYETTDGRVGYANESHRLNDVQDNGYWLIPLNYINARGVASSSSLNNLANDFILTYKNNAIVTGSSPTSIALYGTQAASIATELENAAEASYQIDQYIARRATPQTSLSRFSIQIDSPNISLSDVDVLLNMYMGKPIQIDNLPIPILHNTYKGFVEGWILSFNSIQCQITLTSTDSTLSLPPTRWQDVSPTQKWTDVGATVQWPQYE